MGTVASVTSNQIVLTDPPGALQPLNDADQLYKQTVSVDTFYYGRHHNSASNAYDPIYFKGALSDIALWDKGLTQSDVSELYSARTVWD